MTITLPLQPQEEAKLNSIAHAKGLSADALVRQALDEILADAPEIPDNATGDMLVAAMQASPFKDMDLAAVRTPLPTRDVEF